MKHASSIMAAASVLGPMTVSGTPILRRVEDGISSCADRWMPIDDVSIAQGTDMRTGYTTAVDNFCSTADGQVVPAGGYLSMATEVFLNGGEDPTVYGVVGFVYFEVHNKIDSDHTVVKNDCVTYLTNLSAEGSDCAGDTNGDTKGGTWQVGNEDISYHALGEEIPPAEDALNVLFTDGAISTQSVNTGGEAPLNPWPLDSLNSVKPTNCHSHNDYEQNIPLFSAMSAGCISIEADVWYEDGDVVIGHLLPTSGRTLSGQYVEPLRAILDHNNGGSPGDNGLYAAAPGQTVHLLVDFKTSDTETLDATVSALQSLRDGNYLSYRDGDTLVERPITVVLSGNAEFDRIKDCDGVPNCDVFYDAKLDNLTDEITELNSQMASMSYDDSSDVVAETDAAHAKGLLTRYYALPSEDMWEELASQGVDFLNADDMYNTARLSRI